MLAHSPLFRREAIQQIPAANQTVAGIEDLLRNNGAPMECYVISELEGIGGRFMPLTEALAAVVGMGMGSIVSCIPGQLAFYEGEMPKDRYILAAT